MPTDDIQIWLKCAGINDKTYTTLAEVLADTSTLVALMASDNAVDYLVRSTSFIYGVGTVPAMTSATTPSGTVGGSLTSTGYEAYKAFDGDDITYALRSGASSGGVDYTYNQAENIKAMYVFNASSISLNFTIYYKETAESTNVTASNTIAIPSNSGKYIHTTSNNISGVTWGAYAATVSGTADLKVSTIQFYNAGIAMSEIAMKAIGASDYAAETLLADSTWCDAIYESSYFDYVANVAVPKMTSDTTPSGTCIQSGVASGYYAYNAFDRDDSTHFYTNAAISGAYIGYTFPTAHKISKCKMLIRTNTTAESHYTYKVQGSNDGFSSDIHDLTDAFNITLANQGSVWVDKELDNTNAYKSFRLYSTVTLEESRRMGVSTMQIFDREPGGVQTWLRKAGITDKNYTTLAEVLNDSTTLATLMASKDAVDYLVTCKGWTTAQALVPTMTSDTTPSGRVLAGQSMSSTNPAYMMFDGLTNNQPYKTTAANTGWIGYDFEDSVSINSWKVYCASSQRTALLGYSDDGVNWTDYSESLQTTANAWATQNVIITSPHRYWRCAVTLESSVQGFGISEAQFYAASITDNATAMSYIGANNYAAETLLADNDWCNAICNSEYFESVLNVKVPVMTSATTPSGQAFVSEHNIGHEGWRVFDGGLTYWNTPRNQSNAYVGYIFPSSHKIYLGTIRGGAGYNHSDIKSVSNIIQTWNGSAWVDVSAAYNNIAGDGVTNQIIKLLTPTESDRFRLYIGAPNYGTQGEIVLFEVQFYGREDV